VPGRRKLIEDSLWRGDLTGSKKCGQSGGRLLRLGFNLSWLTHLEPL
jgi:hypothetical protein